MELESQVVYLVMGLKSPDDRRTLSISPSVAHVVKNWNKHTRLSPLCPVKQYGCDLLGNPFAGKQKVLFFGPLPPRFIYNSSLQNQRLVKHTRLWIGLGAFNLIMATPDAACAAEIRGWVEGKCFLEVWTVVDGTVQSSEQCAPPRDPPNWGTPLANFLEINRPLRPAIDEYGAQMATAMFRAGEITPHIVKDLREIDVAVQQWIEGLAPAEAYPFLINVNAGLSRFSAQAYSGIPPIHATECHYWVHSLLGTGTANIALRNISAFIGKKFGSQRISERFSAFADISHNIPFLACELPTFFEEDNLSKVGCPSSTDKIVPFITYFSGRDGFKYKDLALSAPLEAIAGCNSLRWSLLTLTHEISHAFIIGILTHLLPVRNGDESDIQKAVDLTNSMNAPDNWLVAIRQYFLKSIVALSAATDVTERSTAISYSIESKSFFRVLDFYVHEIEEIMVHAFDFLYFYKMNTSKYIKSIWISWSVIPNISHKVREYTLRTLCAVYSATVGQGPSANDAVRDVVLKGLQGIDDHHLVNGYVREAMDIIKNDWISLSTELDARKPFVKIVRGFVYSKSIAEALTLFDAAIAGTSKISQPGCFDDISIENPLEFLENNTEGCEMSEFTSIWMLNTLAHSVSGVSFCEG